MDQGNVVMEGTPREIFSRVEELKKYRLDVPQVTLLAYELQQRGLPLSNGILKDRGIGERIMSITLEHINYTYSEGTAYEKRR